MPKLPKGTIQLLQPKEKKHIFPSLGKFCAQKKRNKKHF